MPHPLLRQIARRTPGLAPATTRRAVLAAGVAGAAGLMLGSGCIRARTQALGGYGKGVVCVIGAGFAGLAAAHELKAAGYEVVVLESRGRLGGRVVSLGNVAEGAVVEGGAEFIGANHPTWLAYAEKFGLQLREATDEGEVDEVLFFDNARLPGEVAEAVDAEIAQIELALTELSRQVDPLRPWTSPRAAEWDAMSFAQWVDAGQYQPITRRIIKLLMSADSGAEAEKLGMLGILAMIAGGGHESFWTDSETYRSQAGNQELAKKLAEGLDVRLSKTARRVETGETFAKVYLASGEIVEADYVVCAVPPSVWDRITFDPVLPSQLAWQMGRTVKHMTPVKARYWREAGLSQYATSDTLATLTWEPTDGIEAGPVALTAFASADVCDRIRAMQPVERDSAVTEAMEKLLPGFVQNVAGRSVFMDWPTDPNSRGGYSFPAPGQLTRAGPVLHAGLDKLAFAGEHCSPAFIGYMEGALASGVRAARAVDAAIRARQRRS